MFYMMRNVQAYALRYKYTVIIYYYYARQCIHNISLIFERERTVSENKLNFYYLCNKKFSKSGFVLCKEE